MRRTIRIATALALMIASLAAICYSLSAIADRRGGVKLSESGVLKTELSEYAAGIAELTLSLRNDGRYPVGGWNIFSLDRLEGGVWSKVASLIDNDTQLTSDLQPGEEMERGYAVRDGRDDKWISYEITAGEYRVSAQCEIHYEIAGRTVTPIFLASAYFSVR